MKSIRLRRLAAITYDGLLVLALLMTATLVALLLTQQTHFANNNLFYQLYLLFVIFIFYGWFWTHGGQTIGMLAWKLKLYNCSNTQITWRQALLRFIYGFSTIALLGIGLWWMLWDKDKRTLYDRLSNTYLTDND